MHRNGWRTVLAIALVSAACGADATAPRTSVAGTYRLLAVNDTLLPITTVVDFVPRTVSSGSMTVSDSTYRFTLCFAAPGATGDALCGAGKVSLVDSGLVWSSAAGASFVDRVTHNSRGLIVSGDTLRFQRSDFATPILKFVR